MELNKIKYSFKKLLVLIVLAFLMPNLYNFAAGNPNMDGGGGGYGGGTNHSNWNNEQEGVRVMVVDSQTGRQLSSPIDYSRSYPSKVNRHFGYTPKRDYLDRSPLTMSRTNYQAKTMDNLPSIINKNTSGGGYSASRVAAIKKHFTDRSVIKKILDDANLRYDDSSREKFLESVAKYKIIVEPVAYFKYKNLMYATTATEAAMLDRMQSGQLRAWMRSLTHKNLPLALFLEEDDIGYRAWNGDRSDFQSIDDIKNFLGIGIVTFKKPKAPPEITSYDHTYRTNTWVYISTWVSGPEYNTDYPAKVTFDIEGETVSDSNSVDGIVKPDGASQLVWIGWRTPSTPQDIKITISGDANEVINARIVDLEENPPPDPQPHDRYDNFRTDFSSTTDTRASERRYAQWYVYTCEYIEEVGHWESYTVTVTGADGKKKEQERRTWVIDVPAYYEFDTEFYSVSVDSVNFEIMPADTNPTANGKEMKSGYGVKANLRARVVGDQNTGIQNSITYFPEFLYKDYWRILEKVGGSYQFKKNKYSHYNARNHYTPIWYPNMEYRVIGEVFDIWTPAGELRANIEDYVSISGDMYDDWHIGPTHD